MATPAEAAQDMTRVLEALVLARQHLEALDKADEVRGASAMKSRPSGLRVALQFAEAAGERVIEFLAGQATTDPMNPRDGGPL